MKRLLAIIAFVAGGVAAEMAHPVNCSLLNASRVQVKRHKR
ncbi:hypothetical protein SAMN05443245_3649 [Paraburkholderia fungorum]|uniref:Uncharacterized protein n=1 Tax=Paraburkholderia fungorum TaxID=134537 RepID=A0A1H1H991_9BURK|nr:hypothetical protein [Paraburkholderia fungorum]SDR21931.1 hypothetical protein SAMN05443245_3649 [Paraburkholderia fungorum]